MQILQINYGHRLTALREKFHWSREQLAVALNVSYSTIRRLEANKTSLTPEYAEAIALAYDLPLSDFWQWMVADISC
jgi:transcriptional regulator with XRE-family HTH domain